MVLSEVPPNSTVVGVPGRVVKRNNMMLPQESMNQTDLPDPVREDIAGLQKANSELTNRLLELVLQRRWYCIFFLWESRSLPGFFLSIFHV